MIITAIRQQPPAVSWYIHNHVQSKHTQFSLLGGIFSYVCFVTFSELLSIGFSFFKCLLLF